MRNITLSWFSWKHSRGGRRTATPLPLLLHPRKIGRRLFPQIFNVIRRETYQHLAEFPTIREKYFKNRTGSGRRTVHILPRTRRKKKKKKKTWLCLAVDMTRKDPESWVVFFGTVYYMGFRVYATPYGIADRQNNKKSFDKRFRPFYFISLAERFRREMQIEGSEFSRKH